MVAVHGYDTLPAAIGASPTLIILPLEGEFDYGAGGPNTGHYEIQMTLYVTTQKLPEAYAQLVPFIELVRDKLAGNMSLDNTVEHCLPSANAPFFDGPGGILYAGVQYLGIIFRIEVKERESSFTVAA